MSDRRPDLTAPSVGPWVRWRHTGHTLEPQTDLLRFDVVDVNRVINNAAAVADLYGEVLARAGGDRDAHALVLSCFAVTESWTPVRLAAGTGFRAYRMVQADRILAAGYQLWPTEVFLDGVPYATNEVHYDLVVATGPELVPAALHEGSPSERRHVRETLAPLFQPVLALLGEPYPLGSVADEG